LPTSSEPKKKKLPNYNNVKNGETNMLKTPPKDKAKSESSNKSNK